MKYALISEDQLEKFNSAIDLAKDARYETQREHYLNDAILIIQSLKPSEPVAFIENHKAGQNLSWSQDDLPYAKATPLYALDEVTK